MEVFLQDSLTLSFMFSLIRVQDHNQNFKLEKSSNLCHMKWKQADQPQQGLSLGGWTHFETWKQSILTSNPLQNGNRSYWVGSNAKIEEEGWQQLKQRLSSTSISHFLYKSWPWNKLLKDNPRNPGISVSSNLFGGNSILNFTNSWQMHEGLNNWLRSFHIPRKCSSSTFGSYFVKAWICRWNCWCYAEPAKDLHESLEPTFNCIKANMRASNPSKSAENHKFYECSPLESLNGGVYASHFVP